ncbi:MAG: hypothetical protein A3I89_01150 [Candidatus Harrisonbacteria bacterium RIFCSPLOWO2_02_FULL_41_11]|uniref:Glycosyltransferase RgtA/B/C/D-like domain-containing protein n=1 Tax=Candidatus Harrisonbacteria bacterium RIFCSPHIGHO2_02_FULL_42_16 TaxID=1798404 RepID=A0A1G1ZIM6_9BACT|nr:MAG: hypothetical protein A3B92_00640 [Candidatus Harrisonbacteria bacterium RIFCSPHIGHO2_02_FULL_42_16]OGY67578.1 MAG: hypothetical protein A3I89_01150 [Candidatus Harrisonbacteria bacterium RIFCSPLOWO2_02_FULL_41_11]
MEVGLPLFGYKITEKQLLIAILLLGALLRFWGLGSAEIFHDEGFYAFRSIGYFDYIQNDAQTTPVQWPAVSLPNGSLPFWTSLSFHDHPPLFFLIQHLFFSIFGDSLLVARLLSFLAGIGAIYLAYLIGKKLSKNELVGILAAALLSVNHIHIWISRSSIFESLLTFLIFLNIYYFLSFLENLERWKMFGITLGLAFLTKYTGFFLVPVYFFYLLIYRREIFKSRYLYASLLITLLLFTPVIIYNFYLYQVTGHFDLQFSYLFRQATPEWQASLGKIQEPFSNMVENLLAMYSIPFLLVVLSGMAYSCIILFRDFRVNPRIDQRKSAILFGWLTFLFITLILIPVGSAFRFIALYLFPFMFFSVTAILFLSGKFPKKIFFPALAVFLAYELYFSIGGIFLEFPNFGVARLDRYLEAEIDGKRPLRLPESPNPHLDAVIKKYGRPLPTVDESLVIVYDENIALSSKLWLFTRRLYYRGILTVTAGQFKTLLQNQGMEAFNNSRIYFVKATENTSLNPNFTTKDAEELEYFLRTQLNLNPAEKIYGYNNLLMFTIYEFKL